MGESVNAWMLPGSTTSSFMAPGFAWITETAGIASSRVVSFTAAAVWMRALMPQKTTPATISTASKSRTTIRSVRGRAGGGLGGSAGLVVIGVSSMGSLSSIGCHSPPVQHTEHRWDKEEGGDGGANQPANNGTAERSVLLPTFTQAHCNRNKTDNHGQRGHQDGPKTRKAGFQSGTRRVALGLQMLLGEADHQDAVGRGHSDAHDGPHQRGDAQGGARDKQKDHYSRHGGGERGDDDERVQPGLEIDHDQEVDQNA